MKNFDRTEENHYFMNMNQIASFIDKTNSLGNVIWHFEGRKEFDDPPYIPLEKRNILSRKVIEEYIKLMDITSEITEIDYGFLSEEIRTYFPRPIPTDYGQEYGLGYSVGYDIWTNRNIGEKIKEFGFIRASLIRVENNELLKRANFHYYLDCIANIREFGTNLLVGSVYSHSGHGYSIDSAISFGFEIPKKFQKEDTFFYFGIGNKKYEMMINQIKRTIEEIQCL